MSTRPGVRLLLTADQALVLFDWMSREDGRNAIPTEHPAEQKVLWEIEGQLERILPEPLRANYAEAVANARQRVIAGEGA